MRSPGLILPSQHRRWIYWSHWLTRGARGLLLFFIYPVTRTPGRQQGVTQGSYLENNWTRGLAAGFSSLLLNAPLISHHVINVVHRV